MSWPKRIFAVLFVLAIAGVVATSLRPKEEKPLTVQAAAARKGSITRVVTGGGKLEAATEVKLSSNITGDLVELTIREGDRVTTGHNCIPRDMVELGSGRFLVGFNVQFGLKREIGLADVFAAFARDEESGAFREAPLDVLNDGRFLTDFKRLYNVYERTTFSKFSLIQGQLYMVFRTGTAAGDIAVFKWAFNGGALALSLIHI